MNEGARLCQDINLCFAPYCYLSPLSRHPPIITKSSMALHGLKVVTSGSGMSTVPPSAATVILSLASPRERKGRVMREEGKMVTPVITYRDLCVWTQTCCSLRCNHIDRTLESTV